MSMRLSYRALLFLAGTILLSAAPAGAGTRSVNIAIVAPSESRAVASIEVNCDPVSSVSFFNVYAGINGLGKRIHDLKAFDGTGAEVSARQIAPGQIETEKPVVKLRYSVTLDPRSEVSEIAHVSWLSPHNGVLMLGDLLPTNRPGEGKPPESVKVLFNLPPDWVVYGNDLDNSAADFVIRDVDRAVFVLGRQLRSSQASSSGVATRFVTSGDWSFTDSEALNLVGDIIKAHRQVFGSSPFNRALVILLPFPGSVASNRWAAETRGATVTLLMGKVPSKVGALAQLSTPLTHELFHLWVPNGLALEGDYDWFYEGFTMYQAARTAMRLELLTFPEFLNALARAYDGYLADKERDRWSLVEASKRRWTGGSPSVYSKSMLVAFLVDLKMRSQSRSKRSLDQAYRQLFSQNGMPASNSKSLTSIKTGDGNQLVLNAWATEPALREYVRTLTQEPATIDLQKELAPYGLLLEKIGLRTRIGASDKLDKHQRELLRELGYNEVVRVPRR